MLISSAAISARFSYEWSHWSPSAGGNRLTTHEYLNNPTSKIMNYPFKNVFFLYLCPSKCLTSTTLTWICKVHHKWHVFSHSVHFLKSEIQPYVRTSYIWHIAHSQSHFAEKPETSGTELTCQYRVTVCVSRNTTNTLSAIAGSKQHDQIKDANCT